MTVPAMYGELAQWLDGKLMNLWPKDNAETNYVFPDNTVKR